MDTEVCEPVRRMLTADAASRALGIVVDAAGDGSAVARMLVRDDMVNGHGLAHGGIIFSLADTTFACACNSFGPTTVAAGAEISFLTSAAAGDELRAVARLRSSRGRTGIYDVTVSRGTDVVAEFRGRSATLRSPR